MCQGSSVIVKDHSHFQNKTNFTLIFFFFSLWSNVKQPTVNCLPQNHSLRNLPRNYHYHVCMHDNVFFVSFRSRTRPLNNTAIVAGQTGLTLIEQEARRRADFNMHYGRRRFW